MALQFRAETDSVEAGSVAYIRAAVIGVGIGVGLGVATIAGALYNITTNPCPDAVAENAGAIAGGVMGVGTAAAGGSGRSSGNVGVKGGSSPPVAPRPDSGVAPGFCPL